MKNNLLILFIFLKWMNKKDALKEKNPLIQIA